MTQRPEPDVGRLYAEGRERISTLVRDLDESTLKTPVPACPEWTVRDIVSHLSGVCADIIGGRLEGVATDPWTARQVEERRDWPIEKVIAEWSDVGPRCEEICSAFGGAELQWMGDMLTHEQDIRTALGRPGGRDGGGIAPAMGFFIKALGAGMTPALRIETEEGESFVMGDGDPAATVRAPRFELFRALTGRRSADQIAAFDWDGDPSQHLQAFGRGPFTVPAQAIDE